MRLTLGGVTVDAVVRSLNDGGLLIQVRLTYPFYVQGAQRQKIQAAAAQECSVPQTPSGVSIHTQG